MTLRDNTTMSTKDKLLTYAKVPPAKLVRIVERLRHHLYRLHQRLVPPPAAMIELILASAQTSQAIQTAAALNIADVLAEGPRRLDELSERVGADPDALSRLMRALISRGIFRQHRDERHENDGDSLREVELHQLRGP